MIKRRVAIQLLTLMVMAPAAAIASNLPSLPVPHITDAPKNMPEGPARMVHFSFTPTPQSTASGYELSEHVQQWSCQPGKDNPPVGGLLPTPGPGQQAGCTLEENWGAVSHGGTAPTSSGSTMLPVHGERSTPGTLYVRVRLRWFNNGVGVKEGGWSAWHRTLVTDTHRYKFMGTKGMHMQRIPAGSLHVNFDMSKHKPPVITAPGPGQVFHGGFKINISGSVEQHKTYSAWSCCDIQWKRALIVTAENTAHSKPGQTAFPTPSEPWQNPQLVGLAVGQAYMEHGSSFHGFTYYSTLRPHHRSFGYRYWFRVRESYWPGGFDESSYYGPWSAWRSFTVQEPLMAATPNHNVRMLPGAHMAKPSSGQQQSGGQHNTRRLAPMPMMRVR